MKPKDSEFVSNSGVDILNFFRMFLVNFEIFKAG